ncbi:hypothetical protein [Streptomyces alfalfae]
MRFLRDVLDIAVPKVRAGAVVAVSPALWTRREQWPGVELAFWTRRQYRLTGNGLCFECWWRESGDHIRACEGGGCLNFARLLEEPSPQL